MALTKRAKRENPVLRAALLAISAVTTGVTLGRRLLKGQVDKQKRSMIEEAGQQARERMRSEAHSYVVRHLTQFSLVLLIKAALLSALVIANHFGAFTPLQHTALLFSLIGLFLLRDAIVTWPVAKFVVSELMKHGWKPRYTIGEIVAARVFDEVLAEAAEQPQSWRSDLLLALSGHKRDEVVQDIAEEVSAIARETSWETLKPYILTGTVMTLALMLLYGGFAWAALSGLVLNQVR